MPGEIWNAWNTTPPEQLPQSDWPLGLHTGVPTTFLIYTDGRTFGGRAIVDIYPGYGELRDGKIDGNNLSFTVTAHPIVNGQRVDQTIYYTGTINGDEMQLVMTYVVRPSDPDRSRQLNIMMKAKRFRQD
jgi:hypothetical protein